jgi:hypothetical protein
MFSPPFVTGALSSKEKQKTRLGGFFVLQIN